MVTNRGISQQPTSQFWYNEYQQEAQLIIDDNIALDLSLIDKFILEMRSSWRKLILF